MREGYSLNSLAELRAIPPEQRTAKSARRVASKNAWYGFNPLSTAEDDNDLAIAPDDIADDEPGRWEMMISATTGDGGGGGGDGDLSDLLDRVVALENQTSYLSDEILNLTDTSSQLDDLVNGLPGAIAQILAALLFEEGVLFDVSYDSGTNETTAYTNYLNSDRWVVVEVRDGNVTRPFEVVYESSGSWIRAKVVLSGDYSSATLRAFIVRVPYEYEIAAIAEDAIQDIGGS